MKFTLTYSDIIVKLACANVIGYVAKDCLLIDSDLVHKNCSLEGSHLDVVLLRNSPHVQ